MLPNNQSPYLNFYTSPSRHATLNNSAVEELRRLIILGELAPGTLLKDAEVASQMGLSNTPVREAFVKLSAEGLIDIVPNKSKRVSTLNKQAMVDLLMVQTRLWELAYEWGSQHIGNREFVQLKESVDLQAEAMVNNDTLVAITASLEFHLILMRASGNQELVRLSIDRLAVIQRFVILKMPWLPNEEMLDIHRCMYQEFVTGHPENALVLFRQAYGALIKDIIKLPDDDVIN